MGVSVNKNGTIIAPGSSIGENILLNSATLAGKNGSTTKDGITTGIHNGGTSWSEQYPRCSISAVGNPLNGQQVTISLDFKCNDVSKISTMYFGFATFNSSGARTADMNITVSGYTVIDGTRSNDQWCRMAYTLTVPTSWTSTTASTYNLQIKTDTNASGVVMNFKKIKIELGNKPTPWTPCSNDYNIKADLGLAESIDLLPTPHAKLGTDWISCTELLEI